MSIVRFEDLLAESSSVPELATRLGRACLDESDQLEKMKSRPHAKKWIERIENIVQKASLVDWEEIVDNPSRLPDLDSDFCRELALAQTRQPLDLYAILRGLCAGALYQLYYELTDDIHRLVGPISVRKGSPMPYVRRELWKAADGGLTPRRETVRQPNSLGILAFDFFELDLKRTMAITFDYRNSSELDALTYDAGEGFPLIATIHPTESGNPKFGWRNRTHFFGLSPSNWDAARIGESLTRAKRAGAQIALLPELSLPAPGSMATQIAANHKRYPPLIVAGSAHVQYRDSSGALIRANESHIYLRGECVAIARKCRPYVMRSDGGEVREAITSEPKTITVLCGRKTRLAVVICADVNNPEIPRLLVEAGVNLLLVPSMTEKAGAFNSPISDIASNCQGVAAIANVRFGPEGEPFLMMGAAPFSKPEQQTGSSNGEGREPPPEIAVFNPNEPFPQAVTWIG